MIVDAAARCVTAGYAQRLDWETENFVAHTLKGEGFDASEDGTGRGTPIVPVFAHETAATLPRGAESSGKGGYAGRRQEDDVNLVSYAIQAGALRENPESGPDGIGVQAGIAYTLEARAEVQAIQSQWAVRRLIPRECERLQGFSDDFTLIPYRNRFAADGPRYKALGNSMAVNVMRWIGQRIQQVETITARAA